MKTTTIDAIRAGAHEGAVLIDVRTPGEHAGVHAEGALTLPLDQITADAVRRAAGDRHQILVLCQSGNRARKACEQLGALEGCELLVVEGGTGAWQEAGLPVVRGRGVIPIERQVRIVAGFLVALGVALGYWVHPGFLGLSAFVGVGLMVAGITDFCGMGLLLARMPWNRRPGTACGAGGCGAGGDSATA